MRLGSSATLPAARSPVIPGMLTETVTVFANRFNTEARYRPLMQSVSDIDGRAPPLKGMRILVVEDSLYTANLIRQALMAAGAEAVVVAADAATGLSVLSTFKPDVLVTNRTAPLNDGLAMVKSVRQAALSPDANVPNPAIPIVLLSGTAGRGAVHEASSAGIDAFVVKPFSYTSLVKRVERAGKRKVAFIVSEDYIGPDRGVSSEADKKVPSGPAPAPLSEMFDISPASVLKALYQRIRDLEDRQAAV